MWYKISDSEPIFSAASYEIHIFEPNEDFEFRIVLQLVWRKDGSGAGSPCKVHY